METSELLRRAQEGSPEAANALYERCAGRVLAYVRLRLGRELRSRLESRDILQATLVKSLERLPQLRGEDARSLMGWLAKIADNEIRDRADYYGRQRRDAARETPIEDDAPVPALTRSALSRLILDERSQQLEAALDALSPEHREVILLRKFQELPFAEVGRRMGKSEDASRMLLARAMTTLTLKMAGAEQ